MSDKKTLLEYVKTLGIEISTYRDDATDGQFDMDGNIILLEGRLEEKSPKAYISTILHEIGHYFETYLQVSDFENENAVVLMKEYIAGIYGYCLLKKLGLAMPTRYYLKENSSSLLVYTSDLFKELDDDMLFDYIIETSFRYLELTMPALKKFGGARRLPKSLTNKMTSVYLSKYDIR